MENMSVFMNFFVWNTCSKQRPACFMLFLNLLCRFFSSFCTIAPSNVWHKQLWQWSTKGNCIFLVFQAVLFLIIVSSFSFYIEWFLTQKKWLVHDKKIAAVALKSTYLFRRVDFITVTCVHFWWVIPRFCTWGGCLFKSTFFEEVAFFNWVEDLLVFLQIAHLVFNGVENIDIFLVLVIKLSVLQIIEGNILKFPLLFSWEWLFSFLRYIKSRNWELLLKKYTCVFREYFCSCIC